MGTIRTIDDYSAVGFAEEDINYNFALFNSRMCNIAQSRAKLIPLFNFISELSANFKSYQSQTQSASADWRSVGSLVHATSGYWLEPITLMYQNTFSILANHGEIETWLDATFLPSVFASNQILKVQFLVKNFDPTALNGTFLEKNSKEVLDSLAATFNQSTTNIQKYLSYTNHINAMISVVNSNLKRLNRKDLLVSDKSGLHTLYTQFSIFQRQLAHSELTNVSQEDLKIFYSVLVQYELLAETYQELIDLGIPNIPPISMQKFNTQNIVSTYVGTFCFVKNSQNKWKYIPSCNIDFCVDDICNDCFDYVDPNTLYVNRDCPLNSRFQMTTCDIFSGAEFSAYWTLADMGFLSGGQAGAYRQYPATSTVSASPWDVINNGYGLRLRFEGDSNCVSANNFTQAGSAYATIFNPEPVNLTITWSGSGESYRTVENMSFYIDDVLETYAHSAGGGSICGLSAIVGYPSNVHTVSLAPGSHELRIEATSFDSNSHNGAFYQFRLNMESA